MDARQPIEVIALFARVIADSRSLEDLADTVHINAIEQHDEAVASVCELGRMAQSIVMDCRELANTIGWHDDHPPNETDRMFLLQGDPEDVGEYVKREVQAGVEKLVGTAVFAMADAVLDAIREDVGAALATGESGPSRAKAYLAAPVAEVRARTVAMNTLKEKL